MSHRAPNSTDGYSARMDDLSPMFGEDIYSRDALQYFGTGERSDRAALAAIQKARRNPEATITVYRAVPSNVQDTHIRNGDWVALTPEYAREHGERTLDGDYRIIRETVAAGSFMETATVFMNSAMITVGMKFTGTQLAMQSKQVLPTTISVSSSRFRSDSTKPTRTDGIPWG